MGFFILCHSFNASATDQPSVAALGLDKFSADNFSADVSE